MCSRKTKLSILFNTNDAAFNAYKWRHSDVIIKKLEMRGKASRIARSAPPSEY